MTSTTVWPFAFVRPFEELRVTSEDVVELGHGVVLRRDNLPTPGYSLRVNGTVRLGPTSTLKTWQDFVATYGTTSGFLYKATQLVGRSSSDYNANRETVGEALGTGTGSLVTFYLPHRHIDAASLVVKVDGTPQTGGGTDYTLSNNNTAPRIVFEAGSTPGGGAVVTADYEWYWPVVMTGWQATRHENGRVIRVSVTLAEEQAGLHRA